MSLSLKDVSTDLVPRAKHIVIHSKGGVGKTTFGATAAIKRKGLMLLTGEDGLSPLGIEGVSNVKIGCNVDPENLDDLAQVWVDYQNLLRQLITEKHDYKFLVQDPLSTLVNNAFEGYIVKTFYDSNFDKANAYMAKYQQYRTEFNKIIEAYKILLNKDISILTMCHGAIVDYKDPSLESYKKWELDLPRANKMDLSAALFNHADAVFFGTFDVSVADKKATGTRRVLHTAENAAYTAKNMRLPSGKVLPDPILFDYDKFEEQLIKLKDK